MSITNGFPTGSEKQVVDSALSTTSTNPVQNKIITTKTNSIDTSISAINTTLSSKANTSDVLTKTNTTSFTPTANYHPATKAYVDSKAGGDMKLVYSNTNITVTSSSSLTLVSNSSGLTKNYMIILSLTDKGDGVCLSGGNYVEGTGVNSSGETYQLGRDGNQTISGIQLWDDSGETQEGKLVSVVLTLTPLGVNELYGSNYYTSYAVSGVAIRGLEYFCNTYNGYMAQQKSYSGAPLTTLKLSTKWTSYYNYDHVIKSVKVYEF